MNGVFRIWFAWVSGGIIMAIITDATRDIAVVSVITEVLFFGASGHRPCRGEPTPALLHGS
ncbi:hypothetical protein [Streptomyces sp. NPDC001135]